MFFFFVFFFFFFKQKTAYEIRPRDWSSDVCSSDPTYLQRACDQITQRVEVEGIAIYLEKKDSFGESLLLTAGSGLVSIEQEMADTLLIHQIGRASCRERV